jgi:hypothetical protein
MQIQFLLIALSKLESFQKLQITRPDPKIDQDLVGGGRAEELSV